MTALASSTEDDTEDGGPQTVTKVTAQEMAMTGSLTQGALALASYVAKLLPKCRQIASFLPILVKTRNFRQHTDKLQWLAICCCMHTCCTSK